MLVKQSSFFSWKHRTLSGQIFVRQTVRLTTELIKNLCGSGTIGVVALMCEKTIGIVDGGRAEDVRAGGVTTVSGRD